MKALNDYEIELLRKEHYSHFKTKSELVSWLKKNNWVTVTSRGKKKRKRYQVCTTALK